MACKDHDKRAEYAALLRKALGIGRSSTSDATAATGVASDLSLYHRSPATSHEPIDQNDQSGARNKAGTARASDDWTRLFRFLSGTEHSAHLRPLRSICLDGGVYESTSVLPFSLEAQHDFLLSHRRKPGFLRARSISYS